LVLPSETPPRIIKIPDELQPIITFFSTGRCGEQGGIPEIFKL
jgi:hypothetical protein